MWIDDDAAERARKNPQKLSHDNPDHTAKIRTIEQRNIQLGYVAPTRHHSVNPVSAPANVYAPVPVQSSRHVPGDDLLLPGESGSSSSRPVAKSSSVAAERKQRVDPPPYYANYYRPKPPNPSDFDVPLDFEISEGDIELRGRNEPKKAYNPYDIPYLRMNEEIEVVLVPGAPPVRMPRKTWLMLKDQQRK